MTITWLSVAYTIAIAVGVVLLEGWLTFASRVTRGGPGFPLHLDDAAWWIEWVVTGTVALAIFLILSAHEHKPIGGGQIVAVIIAMFAGYALLPLMANIRCLDDDGKVKSIGWLITLNIAAILILTAAVTAGAKVYE